MCMCNVYAECIHRIVSECVFLLKQRVQTQMQCVLIYT